MSVRNPETGRMVLKRGAVYKRLVRDGVLKGKHTSRKRTSRKYRQSAADRLNRRVASRLLKASRSRARGRLPAYVMGDHRYPSGSCATMVRSMRRAGYVDDIEAESTLDNLIRKHCDR